MSEWKACEHTHPTTGERCVFGAGHPVGYHLEPTHPNLVRWTHAPNGECAKVCTAASCRDLFVCQMTEQGITLTPMQIGEVAADAFVRGSARRVIDDYCETCGVLMDGEGNEANGRSCEHEGLCNECADDATPPKA